MKIQSSIIVKYHGPTNHRGSRWSAKTARWADKVITGYDYSIGIAENVRAAAQAYIDKYALKVEIVSITEIDEKSYAVAFN